MEKEKAEKIVAIIDYEQTEDHREVYANGVRTYIQWPHHLKIAFYNDVPVEQVKEEEIVAAGTGLQPRVSKTAFEGPPRIKRTIHTTIILPFGAVRRIARILGQVAREIEEQEQKQRNEVTDDVSESTE